MRSRRPVLQDLAFAACAALLCAAMPAAGQAVSAREVSSALARTAHISTQSGARVDAQEAALRLVRVQLARDESARPLPAEYVHNGETRVPNYAYWRRQEKLRLMVEEAQRRSNETNRLMATGAAREARRSIHARLAAAPAPPN